MLSNKPVPWSSGLLEKMLVQLAMKFMKLCGLLPCSKCLHLGLYHEPERSRLNTTNFYKIRLNIILSRTVGLLNRTFPNPSIHQSFYGLIMLSVINTMYESSWDSIFSSPRFLLHPLSYVQICSEVQCSQMRCTNGEMLLQSAKSSFVQNNWCDDHFVYSKNRL
jgi:hypothetical protein